MTESDSGFYNYETVAYSSHLVIGQGGRVTRFIRHQRIKFLEDDVAVVFDRVWGEGVIFAGYDTGSAKIVDAILARKGYVVVLKLPRNFRKGETYELNTERTIIGAFADRDAYWELAMAAPAKIVNLEVQAPTGRAMKDVEIVAPDIDGLSADSLEFSTRMKIVGPKLHVPYRIQWQWN